MKPSHHPLQRNKRLKQSEQRHAANPRVYPDLSDWSLTRLGSVDECNFSRPVVNTYPPSPGTYLHGELLTGSGIAHQGGALCVCIQSQMLVTMGA